MQYRIGEFSRITGLSIKALRLYHDEGLLPPDYIDDDSGYRYYDESKIRYGFVIAQLREMGFPLKEIGDILTGMKEGREFTLIAPIFEKRLGEIKSAILREKSRERMIRSMMKAELENDGNMFAESKMNREEITEGSIGPWCILSHRYRGRYDEAGRHFSRLFRLGGIHADGRRGSFYYDGEYREDDADVECFILLKKQIESRDSSYASVRQIPEFRSLSLTHTGAYESIGGSYQRLYREFKERHLDVLMPTGTLYLKGPGIFFRGDPDHYRTQIFFPIA